jgi:hypothetical protein
MQAEQVIPNNFHGAKIVSLKDSEKFKAQRLTFVL